LLHETTQTIDMEQAELEDLLAEWQRRQGELEAMTDNC
jgi:hypothetical protein